MKMIEKTKKIKIINFKLNILLNIKEKNFLKEKIENII